MPARRCSLCGINYPHVTATFTALMRCPIHNEPTRFLPDDDPDDDWSERAAVLVAKMAQELDDGIPVPDLDPESVFTENGRTFIWSWDVIQRGVGHRLPEGALLRANGKTYEVLGYIDSMRAYWVTEFSMYLTDRELAYLAGGKKPRKKKKP